MARSRRGSILVDLPCLGWPLQAREALRGAVYQGDGAGVAALVRRHGLHGPLQLAGEGFLLGAPDAGSLAEQLAGALRERGWDGDDVLAEEIEGSVGLRPIQPREVVPADLETLEMAMNGDPGNGRAFLGLQSGEVFYPDYEGQPLDEESEDFLLIPTGSRDAWNDMATFADAVADPRLSEQLREAIRGRGAFRAFRVVIDRNEGLLQDWYTFRDERSNGRARAWLAEHGYKPTIRSRTS